MTLQNEKFEELLSRQLVAELEPQRGRAAAAFAAQMAAEKAAREAERAAREIAGGSKQRESWARREVSRPAAWMWMGVPSLIAASLAIVLTLHLMSRPADIAPERIATSQPTPPPAVPAGTSGYGTGRMASDWQILPQPTNPYPLPQ